MIPTTGHIFRHMHPVDNEEKHLAPVASIWECENWSDHSLFMVSSSLDFFPDDLDLRILLGTADRLDKNLVLSGDNLMQREFELTN